MFYIKNEIKPDCGPRCYTSYTNVTACNNENEIYKYDFNHEFRRDYSFAIFSLGILTGYTVFLTLPVTLPIMAKIKSNIITEEVTHSNDYIAKNIAKYVTDYSLYK